MVVKMRLRELAPSKSPYWETNAPDLAQCRQSIDWAWRFYAALYGVLVDGDDDIDPLVALSKDEKAQPFERAAAAAAAATLLVERGRPHEGLQVVQQRITADNSEPVDHGWLLMHSARCLAEAGELDSARDCAIEVHGLRVTFPRDPTAMALVGAAADLIFSTEDWPLRSVSDAVTGQDTIVAWWRTQEVAWALQFQVREDFKQWARDSRITWGKSDQAWLHLRAATLIAGFSADHSAWRSSFSQLAQRVSTTSLSDPAAVSLALTMMRRAGDSEALTLAVPHLLRIGPVAAVRDAASAVDIERTTRTSLHADLQLIRRSADVLGADDADRFAAWCLQVLAGPADLRRRLSPTFVIPDAILDVLGALVPALSDVAVRTVIEHVLGLEAQQDQAVAHGYAAVIRRTAPGAWTQKDRTALADRRGDNFELAEEIVAVLAAGDDTARRELTEQIANGDLAALEAFGDVRDLDATTVVGLVQSLTDKINKQVTELRSGQSSRGRNSFAATLIIVNAWHPEQANWDPVHTLLSTSSGFTYHLRGPLEVLARLNEHVPADIAVRLEPVLRGLMTSPPPPPLIGDPDVRGAAAIALDVLHPGAISDAELIDMLHADAPARSAAARIVGHRKRPEQWPVLATLAGDPEPEVQTTVAIQLGEWLSEGIAVDAAAATLRRLLAGDGTGTARFVASHLAHAVPSEAFDYLAEQLRNHPSAFVRAQLNNYWDPDAD
ncbi:HEAT repeat domain-containing protein [Mycobacterium riyadhense]|uniref:HEAT repeat domain-containing protein n=1 Tax=Mycobacterium riyadhense TaxID=486698 RepID=UPI00195B05D9|nr:HEAT repeat domain-containing protein [Mycobacterium riyadhense]